MTDTGTAGGAPASADFTVTRVFDVPVSRAWRAWQDPDDVRRWWGPDGFTAPLARMDFRIGGSSLVCMRAPDGTDLYNTWTYEAIDEERSFEFRLHFADADGRRVAPEVVGLPPGIPDGVRHRVTFTALSADRTEVAVTEYGYPAGPVLEMSKAGQEQVMDKMAVVLGSGPAEAATGE